MEDTMSRRIIAGSHPRLWIASALAAVLAAVGVVATVVEIPVLSDLTRTVRGYLGI